jgi:hypothetical protein
VIVQDLYIKINIRTCFQDVVWNHYVVDDVLDVFARLLLYLTTFLISALTSEYAPSQWTHYAGTDGYFNILELPDDRLIFIRLDTVKRSYDVQNIVALLVLLNDLLGRIMMLLV